MLDNSSARQPMRRVLEAHESLIVFRLRRLPKWLRENLDQILNTERSRNMLMPFKLPPLSPKAVG